MGPILFLYHEESLVSSNLNSKLFWFRSAHPNIECYMKDEKSTIMLNLASIKQVVKQV